jgi:leucyl-tRNA synthetase
LAPHITEEIASFFQEKTLAESDWPTGEFWPNSLSQDVNIVVQINGQKKTVILLPRGKNEAEITELVKNNEKVKKILLRKQITRTIIIKDKLINFVTI